ncbi:response regulator transcription factor [Fundicoccus sp. Sow4_H7]|uniref:response regulator transcription factor n=1 Tax=Fundicoccus sp. Sow4_H7 TaxID=3438784 RepID=UPI003F917EE6
MTTIIIVEDDAMLQQELVYMLEKADYQTIAIKQFDEQIVETIKSHQADLLLLDLNLPGQSGFEICKQLTATTNMPILILTSRDLLKDELRALELGADDYITKPVQKEKLLARIQSILRRTIAFTHLIKIGPLQLDQQTYSLYVGNQIKVLTQNEGKLLQALMQAYPNSVTKEELTTLVWGTNEYIDDNTLQVNIGRLRKNLQELGLDQAVKTIRGQGYQLMIE